MKTPQLFVKIGKNKFIPVYHPVRIEGLYFWDDTEQAILPAEGKLKPVGIEGVLYFVF